MEHTSFDGGTNNEPESGDSPGSVPDRGILAKMALAGAAALAVGTIGIAGIAAASNEPSQSSSTTTPPAKAPAELIPLDVPMEPGGVIEFEKLTQQAKELLGMGEHNNMENWDACPPCGMG